MFSFPAIYLAKRNIKKKGILEEYEKVQRYIQVEFCNGVKCSHKIFILFSMLPNQSFIYLPICLPSIPHPSIIHHYPSIPSSIHHLPLSIHPSIYLYTHTNSLSSLSIICPSIIYPSIHTCIHPLIYPYIATYPLANPSIICLSTSIHHLAMHASIH